jgi:hypothetical protein
MIIPEEYFKNILNTFPEGEAHIGGLGFKRRANPA